MSFDSLVANARRSFAVMRFPDAYPTLVTARLELRPFRIADAPAVQRLAGVREVADTTATIPHPYPDGVAEDWIRSHAAAWAAHQQMILAITLKTSGEFIGAIGFVFAMQHQRAELGYWIGVPYWGSGYATEAAGIMVDFGFNVLGLKRVQAHHFARNPASGRVLTKAGLHFEGVSPRAFQKNGRFEDVVFYGAVAAATEDGRTEDR